MDFHGKHLGLKAVCDKDDVTFVNRLLHELRCCAYRDASLFYAGIRIAENELAIQRADNVGVLRVGSCQRVIVEDVHVGVGDVLHCDDALKVLRIVGDA